MAHAELSKRTVYGNDFNQDDAYAFKNAYMCFGKNFMKIKQMVSIAGKFLNLIYWEINEFFEINLRFFKLCNSFQLPHKTMGALIEHYYRTKKQQNYKSYMDNEATRSRSDSTSERCAFYSIANYIYEF